MTDDPRPTIHEAGATTRHNDVSITRHTTKFAGTGVPLAGSYWCIN